MRKGVRPPPPPKAAKDPYKNLIKSMKNNIIRG